MAAGVSWLRVSVCSAPTRKGRSPCPGHTRVPGLLQRESTILRSPGKAGCRTYRCAVLHWRGRPFFKNIREEVQALAKAQTLDTEGERKEVSLSGRTSLCVCPAAVCAPHLPTAAVLRPLPGSAVGTPAPSFAGLRSFDSSTPSGRFLGKDAGEISSKVSRNENVFALFLHGRVEPGLEPAASRPSPFSRGCRPCASPPLLPSRLPGLGLSANSGPSPAVGEHPERHTERRGPAPAPGPFDAASHALRFGEVFPNYCSEGFFLSIFQGSLLEVLLFR